MRHDPEKQGVKVGGVLGYNVSGWRLWVSIRSRQYTILSYTRHTPQ